MAIRKIALFVDMTPLERGGVESFVKLAAANLSLEGNSEASKIIQAEMAKHSTALFFKAKAIAADEVNSNGDYFSWDELIKSYATFRGVPFFTNHNNQDVENARGKIVWSELNPQDKSVYVVGYVDAEAYPHICRGIKEDYMSGVSMGALNGEALILMADGTEKPISLVTTGESVRTPLGNTCCVEKIHNEYLGKPMYGFELETYHRSPLFTEDHPIWMIGHETISNAKKEAQLSGRMHGHYLSTGRPEKAEFLGKHGAWRDLQYSPNFCEAGSVNIGDYFLIPSKFDLIDEQSENSDLYYLIGAFVGEGYFHRNKSGEIAAFAFCLGSDELEFAGKLRNLIRKYCKAEPSDVVIGERNGLYISVWDKAFAQWLYQHLGSGAKSKRLAIPIKFKSDAQQLISGYLDADGCIVDKSNQVLHGNCRGNGFGGFQISSVNLGLLEDIQSLFIALGHPSRISKSDRKPSENSIVRIDTTEYTLSTGSNSSLAFGNSLKYSSFGNPVAQQKAGKSFITKVNNKNYLACPVKKIVIHEDFQEPVYDLTVTKDECYIANGVSVHNCSVDFSVCSICKNKAASVDEYCPHIKNRKGRKFSGTSKNVQTGEISNFRDALVYEENYGIRFIELSGVADPACRSCRIQGVYDQSPAMERAASVMRRVANLQNSLYLVKESEFIKESSQENVTALEGAIQSLENVCTDLIKNRKQVEMDFAADGVNILAEFQTWLDELVGAGYGQLNAAAPGGIPGVADAQAAPAPDAAAGAGGAIPSSPPIAGGTQPAGMSVGAPGTVSGSPMAPQVSAPMMPTAPVRPMASANAHLTKIAEKIAQIRAMLTGDEQMQRRLPSVAAKEKQEVMQTLSNSWKEKQGSPENKQITNSESATGGGKFMTTVNASRTDAPETITEKQLDQAGGYHPRDGKERNETTQKQLDAVRQGDEKEVVTERQIDGKREDSTPTVTTQKQLDSLRKNDEKTSVTQKQLEGERKNDEKEVVTEKQLDGMSGSGEWKGTSKSASEVVASVVRVLAATALNEEATAELAQEIVAKQTETLKAKNELLNQITDSTEVAVDVSSAKTANARKSSYLTAAIVNGLKTLVASDKSINPEDVVCVLEAIAEQKEVSISRIAAKSQELVKEAAAAATVKTSKKADILNALAGKLPDFIQEKIDAKKDKGDKGEEKCSCKDGESCSKCKPVDKEARVAERAQFSKLASKEPNFRIEATMEEIGLTNEILASNATEAKKVILAFVKGVSATQGKVFAGITNVTVDGEKVHIAIQWDENEGAVDLDMPAGDSPDLTPEAPAPEGDITGEGMDDLAGAAAPGAGVPPSPAPAPAPAAPGGAPTPPPNPAGLPVPTASSKGAIQKKAQSQMGGQVPGGAGAGGAGAAAGGAGTAPAPTDEAPMPALTGEGDEDEGVGESDRPGQFPAGAVCHFCGAKDVDIGKEGRGPGVSECNNCGAVWETLVTINILNPEDVEFKEDKEAKVEEPEEPELPSMPVAAQTTLNARGLHKVAELEKQHGHVCPGCGQTECKPIKQTAGSVEYICPSCETKSVKEMLVDPNSPKEAVLRVSWNLDPKKLGGNCKTCKEVAQKFAARMTVAKMMKSASLKQKESPFPRANCVERLAREYGINAVASFGPCKGKALADCVCKELEAFGMRSVRKMEKLAKAYMQEDPMAECLKDQLCKGYKQATAEQICNTLKKVYASEADKNILLLAWGDEPDLNQHVIEEMDSKLHGAGEGAPVAPVAPESPATEVSDDDLGAPLEGEKVVLEVSQGAADELQSALDQSKAEATPETPEAPADVEVVEGAPAEGAASGLEVSQPVMASAKGNNTMQKEAKSPTIVEHIETEVKAGIPRSDAMMGNESKAESMINEKPKAPAIPRKDQTLGQEGKDNINVALKEVDVPTGGGFIGGEAEAQKGLPENSVKSKGTVIANEAKPITKEAKSPTIVEHIETEVKAGIPRKDETLGNEGKDNIDVKLATPEIPRKDQTLGNEGKDNINVSTKEVDVPTGSGFMGGEAEAQKGLPENSVKSKGTVIAESDKRIQHEAKLREARREKARMVAAKLLGKGIITEAAFEQTVEDLACLPLNRIEAHASLLFGATQVKTASTGLAPVLTAAVVVESKTPEAPKAEKSQAQILSELFTIGNKATGR